MKARIFVLILAAAVVTGCIFSNDCQLSESYTQTRTLSIKDVTFERYIYDFELTQKVEVYSGDCADEKNKNETRYTVTSTAPCEQTVFYRMTIISGQDSVRVEEQGRFLAGETKDFGVIENVPGRIDYDNIQIYMITSVCPNDSTAL